MNPARYPTLAAVRAASPEQFDAMIKNALLAAAQDVGSEVLIKALCGSAISPAQRAWPPMPAQLIW